MTNLKAENAALRKRIAELEALIEDIRQMLQPTYKPKRLNHRDWLSDIESLKNEPSTNFREWIEARGEQ